MRVSLLLLPLAMSLLVACTDSAIAPYPKSLPPQPGDAVLGPGDVFEVKVSGEPDLSGTFQVSEDGTINFPLIGRVTARGQRLAQLETSIQSRLADGFLRSPFVSLRVVEYNSRRVSVLGQVKQPGTFPYSDNMSIIEGITRAGGFSPLARKNAVRVTRNEAGKATRFIVAVEDISQGKSPNFFLHPGDVIMVPERIL
jgi:protein involved in polysaccharide export with SLBB domain